MKKLPSQSDLLKKLIYCYKTGIFKRVGGKGNVGFVANNGYITIGIKHNKYYAHRLAWKIFYGYDPEYIDHIDGNRANNAIKNLRNVNRKQNQKNMKKPKNNTSGVVGVVFEPLRKKWKAQIQVDKKMIFLGRFLEKYDAVKARKKAEKEYNFHLNHGR